MLSDRFTNEIEYDESWMRIMQGFSIVAKRKCENFIGVALMDFHVSPEGNTWS